MWCGQYHSKNQQHDRIKMHSHTSVLVFLGLYSLHPPDPPSSTLLHYSPAIALQLFNGHHLCAITFMCTHILPMLRYIRLSSGQPFTSSSVSSLILMLLFNWAIWACVIITFWLVSALFACSCWNALWEEISKHDLMLFNPQNTAPDDHAWYQW